MQWIMPSEGGYLEAEGIEKTWRVKQETITREVDILSSRNQYDIILPGTINWLLVIIILRLGQHVSIVTSNLIIHLLMYH